jgi:hypothetical protein
VSQAGYNGWDFIEWHGAYNGTNSSLLLTVDEDKSIVAEFLPMRNIHNSGSNFDIGKFGSTTDFNYFKGMIDNIRIYSTKLSPEQINQLYLDSKDGATISSTIVAEETEVGDVWSEQITPSDGKVDGTMMMSNLLTIVGETNLPPIVSEIQPGDSATDVPILTSQLNFTLTDLNVDLMDYYVSTTPDIGSDSGISVADGVYSLTVSGLEKGTEYTWHVNVTDSVEWTNITSTFTTPAYSPEVLYSVVRTSSDGISYNVWSEAEDWGGWIALPGSTLNRTAAAILDNNLHIVVLGTNSRFYHGYVNMSTESFSGWTTISGSTPSEPVLTASSNSLYLVVRGDNNGIYYRTWDGSWGAWGLLPGKTIDSPAATMLGNELRLVVKGTNNNLYSGILDTSSSIFSGWTKISGATPSAPILTDNESSAYLIVRGNNNKVYYREWASIWGEWIALPGKTTYSPGAYALGDNLHLMVIGTNGKLYTGMISLTTYEFSGWIWLSGITTSPPTLAGN